MIIDSIGDTFCVLNREVAPSAGTTQCAFEGYVCCADEDTDEINEFITLPCGHAFHCVCLREVLGTKCLGFAVCASVLC